MRRAPALVVAVLATVIAVLGTAAPASAHATLVGTDPAEGAVLASSPDTVSFTFDEPVQLVPDGMLAFDATGEQVDIEGSGTGTELTGDLPEGLADGTYVIAWRVVSADGHPIAGSLTFHVGAPSITVEAPDLTPADPGVLSTIQAIVHALDYIALLVAGGLVVFLGWTTRGLRLAEPLRRRLVRAVRGAAVVAIVAALVAVPLAGAYQLGSGLSGVIDPAAFEPGLVGEDLLVLLLQAVGLGTVALLAGREKSTLTGDLLAAVAVWSPALVGHTRAYEPSVLLVLTDALHLSAGAVWLGGLVGLALTLPTLAGRPRDAAQVLTRFSTVAAALLAVLAVTGVLMGWRIVGSWSALVDETWGRLLLVKVALVLVVVAIAAYNRFRLLPQVTGDDGHDVRRRGTQVIRRVVLAEAAVLVAVLAVTGFLTQKPPGGEGEAAPSTADTGVVAAAAGEDYRVLAVLDAGPGLQRRLLVQVQEPTGEPLDLFEAPAVELRSDTVDLGEIPLVPSATGTYTADVVFPTTGAWQLQVSVREDAFTAPVTTLDLVVD